MDSGRTEKINSLFSSFARFNETPFMDTDYQWAADDLRMLSSALSVLVNVFDKENMRTVTRGLSGIGSNLSRVVKILGYDITGKSWTVVEADLRVMKSKRLVRMGQLHEFNFGRLTPFVAAMIEKTMKLGDAFGIGITYKDEILGSFILIMQQGEEVKNPDLVELFVNQLGMTLLSRKAEEEIRKIDQEYRTVFNGSQDAMFLVNVNGSRYVYHMLNKWYETQLGRTIDSIKGMTPREVFGEKIGKQIEDHYSECIAAREPVYYEESFPISGRMGVWHTLLSPVIDGGKVVQIVGSSRDISKIKQWEDELSRERQLFKTTIHSIKDAVITTDTKDRIVILNKVAEALTGWSQEEARGRRLMEVMTTLNDNTEQKILQSRDGTRRYISCSEAPIQDESAGVLGMVIVFRDVTREKQKEEEVRYLGYHDKMTGLHNRTYFEDKLEQLDDGTNLPLGLIMGDSNGLKMVNDAFGHEEGDKLLRQIAGVFKAVCSNDDIIARTGGDEFAVILPRTNSEQVSLVISRIKQMCENESTGPISPSIALGFAVKENMEQDIKKIYKLAEDRMYTNKLVESKSMRSSMILSLKKTLEERTHETEAHASRLKELSIKLGSTMGLYDNELDDLLLLAMLHDIGKIAIPDNILGKPGSLSEDQWKIMKSHCEIGYRIAVASPELAHIADLILSHHEKWDGTGYPQGLKGTETPLLSRIIAVIDAYDAMTNDRPYHEAISGSEALRELKRCSGTQFDPQVVEKALKVIPETD